MRRELAAFRAILLAIGFSGAVAMLGLAVRNGVVEVAGIALEIVSFLGFVVLVFRSRHDLPPSE